MKIVLELEVDDNGRIINMVGKADISTKNKVVYAVEKYNLFTIQQIVNDYLSILKELFYQRGLV